MDTHIKIEVLMETGFSTRSVPKTYKKDKWGNQISSAWATVKKSDSLEGAAVEKGLQPGNKGITVVRSRYRAPTSEDTEDWKGLILIL
jgi:hypothetical protein